MASPTTGGIPVPPEEQPLDPRAIARRSLQASRNASLWWTSAGVVVATVVALVVGTQAGALTLAGVTAVCAVLRAVLPSPGPVAIGVRSKLVDVALLSFFTVVLVGLAVILPKG
jgi:hypothetical protein